MSNDQTLECEWDLFRNLGWYLNGRLQRAESPVDHRERRHRARRKSRLQKKCRFLEIDLRNALMLKNLDIGLPEDSGLDTAGQNGCESLGPIIQLLESHVNEHFVASLSQSEGPGGFFSSLPAFEKYPKLYQLIQYLKVTAENPTLAAGPFNLVTEVNENPAIFAIQSVSVTQELLDELMQLNAYFRRFQSQPGANANKRSRTSAREGETTIDISEDLGFRKHTSVVIEALHHFLPSCRDFHKVMLQLPERGGALDLFLSGCKTNQWQEVRCEHYTPNHSIPQINNLCETLQKYSDQQLRLVVKVLQDNSQNIDYSPHAHSTPRQYPHASFSESLERLIKRKSLRNISFNEEIKMKNKSDTAPKVRFTLREKRILAFRLSLCFLNFFDARFMKESWNPDKIMFLSLPECRLQESQLYISCSLQVAREKELYGIGHPVLTSFARLLLEIDEGMVWPGLKENGDSDVGLIWMELCKYVESAKRLRGQSSYLDAVRETLYLHLHLNETQTMSDCDEDFDKRVRELMYTKIVSLLALEVPPETREQFSHLIDTSLRDRKRQRSEIADANEIADGRSFKNPRVPIRHPVNMESHRVDCNLGLDAEGEHRFENISCGHVSQLYTRPRFLQHPGASSIQNQPRLSKLSQEIPIDNSDSPSLSPTALEVCREFRIAIICALPLEADAVQALFDQIYEDGSEIHRKLHGDHNIYTIGTMGGQNIILCHLPGMGVTNAASAAENLRRSYTQIRLVLITGICGAIPYLPNHGHEEVILGDVIISDSLIKYDFGRKYPDKFERKNGKEEIIEPPNSEIRGLLGKLKTRRFKDNFEREAAGVLQALQAGKGNECYRYPGAKNDILFPAAYPHKAYQLESLTNCTCFKCTIASDKVCDGIRKKDCGALGCGERTMSVQRERLAQSNILPSIHIGKMASADTVMKSGKDRDELAREEDVIGFEMEGAGVWGRVPACVIIKGVCDYADSHKNKKWQRYASATAAAATMAFVKYWGSNTYR
ncbi:hypothetical protein TWF970_002279 [Orbilia oligospora]|nr:hypothetical protein TWF970_002279 [Orbilia oligospora]